MKPAAKFDAIVIGGGHNGLVCAAYLAKAGQKVCVLERRHVLGRLRDDRGAVARLQGLDRGVRHQPVPAADHSRAEAQGVRAQDSAAEPVVVHAAARWAQPAAGAGPGALPARDRQVQHARCGGVSALQRVAGARGRRCSSRC